MGRFRKFLEAQKTGEQQQLHKLEKKSGINESRAVLAHRVISKCRRLRATKDIHEKLDLLASQNADLAKLISAKR